jgi:hypothetical protein
MAHWANMLADTLPVGAAQSFGANHADGSA